MDNHVKEVKQLIQDTLSGPSVVTTDMTNTEILDPEVANIG